MIKKLNNPNLHVNYINAFNFMFSLLEFQI